MMTVIGMDKVNSRITTISVGHYIRYCLSLLHYAMIVWLTRHVPPTSTTAASAAATAQDQKAAAPRRARACDLFEDGVNFNATRGASLSRVNIDCLMIWTGTNVTWWLVVRASDCGLSLYHNCDSTTIRLRYEDAMTHSTTTEVIEITICIRFHCDTTTIRLRRKIDMLIFCSHRIASNGSRRAIRRSRIAVEL